MAVMSTLDGRGYLGAPSGMSDRGERRVRFMITAGLCAGIVQGGSGPYNSALESELRKTDEVVDI